MSTLSEALEPLRAQVRIQGEHGNWNCNDYMLGMFNGLECALATLEKREPEYRRKPNEGWLDDALPLNFVSSVVGESQPERITS